MASQLHPDLRPGRSVAQVEVDKSDVAIGRRGERRSLIGGDRPDLKAGRFHHLFDFERYENLIFYNQHAFGHLFDPVSRPSMPRGTCGSIT